MRSTIAQGLAIFTASTLISACASPSSYEHVVIGNTLVAQQADGDYWAVYLAQDHRFRSLNGRRSDTGIWQIENDQLCLHYQATDDDWCGRFLEDREAFEIYQHSKLSRTLPGPVIRQGNALGL